MKKDIFTNDDNFLALIYSNQLITDKKISIERDFHGKSSYVFFVKCKRTEYVFKFPRTLFQSKLITYEHEILKRLSCEFDYIKINHSVFYDKYNRPYAVYKKIKGKNMADAISLNCEPNGLFYDLANSIFKIHELKIEDYKEYNLFTKKELLEMFCSDFNYEPEFSLIEDIINDTSTIIHGDFHRHNILLNERNDFVAIIDFATFSMGSIYFDIGHMLLSLKSDEQKNAFLNSYEKISKKTLDRDKLNRTVSFIYKMINEHYLPYINNVEK